MIPEDFIQDLLNRVDIVDVVDKYVPLKKAGQNYQACCPFHKEKSPSFTVSPTKQFYHCFGCGAHGSALGFLMEYSGLGFVDAVTQLAESVGMQVPKNQPEQGRSVVESKRPTLVEALTVAMHYYREQLKRSPAAIEYLKQRGLSGKVAAKFGLGFAPAGWQNLQVVFTDYGNSTILLDAGLVIDSEEKGRRYDRFRDRIMFPIFDQKGQVVGFGGRVLVSASRGKGDPKYLNSPETAVFEKGKELYGLPQARQAVRDHGKVLVVEGYMDVVALAQHGVEYAVATLGTACTPDHVRRLFRLADEVIFCFDGDSAGRKAAWRALENCLPQVVDGKSISFLLLPAEHDPDSYVKQFGKEAFEDLINLEAIGFVTFAVRELSNQADLDTSEGRARFLHLAKPLTEAIRAPALRTMLRKAVADRAGIENEELRLAFGEKASPSATFPTAKFRWNKDATKVRPKIIRRPLVPVERRLLQLALLAPQLLQSAPVVLGEVGSQELHALALLLEFTQRNPNILNGANAIEAIQGQCGDLDLGQVLSESLSLFERFGQEELQAEWLAQQAIYRQSLSRPSTLDRKGQLEYKAAHGGLTDAERDEYRMLLLSARDAKV